MKPYITILIINLITAISICAYTFIRRKVTGAKGMFFLMLATSIYSLGYLFEILSTELSTKIIWYNIEYFGIPMIPFFWLLFALQYADYEWLFQRRKILIFAIIPVTTIIMAWTNKYHGIMIKIQGVASSGAVPEILKINGPWYWVNVSYSYLLFILGAIILLRSIFNLPTLYFKQGLILIAGALIPVVGSLLYIFKLTPIKSFDFTTISFTISGVFLTWCLFKLKVFQIIPIVRDKIFDNMEDGLLVVDTDGKIIDANKYCQNLFDFNIKSMIGYDLIKFFNNKSYIINFYISSINDNFNKINENNIKIDSLSNDNTNNFGNNTEEVKTEILLNKNNYLVSNENNHLVFFNEKFLPLKTLSKEEILGNFKDRILIINNIKDDDNNNKNKDTKIFSIKTTTIHKNNNTIAGYLLVFHDITESKSAEKKLFESIQKMENINKLIYELSTATEDSEIYLKTSTALYNIIGFKFCSFFIYNSGLLENKFNYPLENDLTLKLSSMFTNNLFYNEFILRNYENDKITVINKSENSELKKIINEIIPDIDVLDILLIPIKNIGIFLFFTTNIEIINDENLKICKLIVDNSIEALKRIWLQKSLKEQAEIDPLTGIYNRRYFDNYIGREVQRSKKYKYPITFIMIDVDRFKEVNDKYGHQVGDMVLKGVGAILRGQTRKIDTVIRYGGDEFLIILPGVSNENIEGFINRIKTAVVQWNNQVKLLDFNIDLSMGVVSWDPESDFSIEKVLNEADIAMYVQKKEKSKEKKF
ncbi:MAG: diguanylate cyclase [Actinobacteria bacterium]|nr:diguanylate cyclase [Cyanobacteriota bacterium]MCL5771401.1 diguanylate cyclase [Actinomycetota bacterium]